MSTDPIRMTADAIDLRNRFVQSTTIIASPALAAETTIAQLTITEPELMANSVWVSGWIAFTVGATGTAIRCRIRRGGLAGTVVGDTGAITGGIAAAALVAQDVEAVDTAAVLGGQQYTLTLQVTGGSGASTVSAVSLKAIAV